MTGIGEYPISIDRGCRASPWRHRHQTTLYGGDQQLALSGELGLGKTLGSETFSIVPRASIRGAYVGPGNVVEYGGPAALVIKRHAIRSAQGRIGAAAKADMGGISPYVTANFVHEFNDQPGLTAWRRDIKYQSDRASVKIAF